MKTHTLVVSDLIQQYADGGIGAEIGVYQGDTSRHILATTKTKMLYMVDQYLRDYDPSQWMYSNKRDPKGNPDQDHDNVQLSFSSQFSGRFALLRESSQDAAKELDVPLDFVFIDADHRYEHVLPDLEAWIPKVRPGGLIMGHDWWSKFPGVIIAVTEYANSTKSFVMPKNPKPLSKLPSRTRYMPAPWRNPVIIKSWPAGHVWWALKNG